MYIVNILFHSVNIQQMAVECWDITNNRKVDELSQQVELSAFRGSTVQVHNITACKLCSIVGV